MSLQMVHYVEHLSPMSKPKIDTFNYYDMVLYAARNSSSIRELSNRIGCRRWYDELYPRYSRRRPFFRGNNSPFIVNWGSTKRPEWLEDRRFSITPRYLNLFDKVATAVDKLKFFQAIGDYNSRNNKDNRIPLLNWTHQVDTVREWIRGGHTAVVRSTTTGSSGKGIRLLSGSDPSVEVPQAPLYTRYYPKTHEFRVHVFNGALERVPLFQVIDFTQKKYSGDLDARSDRSMVRSHSNGWVHAHDDITINGADRIRIEQSCMGTLHALGLDFGAVDVLAILDEPDDSGNRPVKSFKICEVNTAPGLENTVTIEAYKQAIESYYTSLKGAI